MPQLDFDGAASRLSADNIRGQSGSTITIVSGHNLSGSGSGLTALPAANLTGTIAAISGANLTNLNGSNIASGTLPMARLSGTLPALDGSALTAVVTRAKGISSTYDISTASGTQDVTGFGFNPRYVIGNGQLEGTDCWYGGWTEVGVMDRCSSQRGSDGNYFARGQFPSALVDGSNHCLAVVSSITDGIRLTWTKTASPTGTLQLYFLGFK